MARMIRGGLIQTSVTHSGDAPIDEIKSAMIEKYMGALIGKGGLFGSIIRITPPMCISEADIDFLLEVLDAAFAQTEGVA